MARGRPRKSETSEEQPAEEVNDSVIDENPQEDAPEIPGVVPVAAIEVENTENVTEIDDNIEKTVANLLKGSYSRNGPPTIVRFSAGFGNFDKTVILPVSFMSLEAAWNKYKSMSDLVSPEKFLNIVYKTLNLDIPRIYCAIPEIKLE